MTGPGGTAIQGILWMATAAICFSVTFGLIRAMSGSLHIFEIVLLRNFLGLLFLLPWLFRAGPHALKTTRWKRYSVRALTGYVAMVLWFYALASMKLAEASALQFTMPLWGVLFAVLFLRESAGASRWLATLAGFAGALIIIRPGLVEVGPAALAAIASAAIYSGNNIITKTLTRTDDPTAVTFHGFLFGLPLAAIPALLVWKTPAAENWPLIIAFGLATAGAHISLTRALAAAEASLVSPVDYLRLPVVALIGYVFFAEIPDSWTWAGAAVIIASTWYLTAFASKR